MIELVVMIISLVIAITAAAVCFMTVRRFHARLHEFTAAAERLASGDYNVSTGDEALNQIAASLHTIAAATPDYDGIYKIAKIPKAYREGLSGSFSDIERALTQAVKAQRLANGECAPDVEREYYDRSQRKWYLIKEAENLEFKTDITKYKNYESETRNLYAIIAVPDAGIVMTDRRGLITEWNPGAEKILGRKREETIGKSPKDFAPREAHKIIDGVNIRLLNGEHITYTEEKRRHKNGRSVYCAVSYSPIISEDGEVTGSVSIIHDVTEKRELEKAQEQIEETLLNLFDNLSHGFVLFELYHDESGREDLKLVSANKAFVKFTDKQTQEREGMRFNDVFGAANEALPYYLSVARRISSGRTREYYSSELGMHMSEIVFSPSEGRVALLLTDRTLIVNAQDAVKKHEDDLAMLFGSLTAGFCMGRLVRGEDGNPVDVIYEMANVAYETIEDFPTGSLIGRRLSEVSPEEWDRYFNIYAQVATTRRKTIFTKHIPEKGKVLDVVCYSPDENCFACIESDVTERVRKDDELKKAYRDTEAIISELPAPICSVSRENGVILGCNKEFVSMCAASSESELKGVQINAFLADNTADDDLMDLLGSGKFTCFLNRSDGTYLEVEVFSRPFVYKEQMAYAVCCMDLTHQKLREGAFRKAALSAVETSRLKSMFLANMSHEIRTPMNGIIGLAELALDGGSHALTPKTIDYLSKIKTSAMGLLGIINDILDISKIEAGKLELESVPFTLTEVFKSCEAVTGSSEKSRDVELLFDCGDLGNERVLGDPTKLRQILMNLLSNAIKFTDEGTVELSAQVIKRDKLNVRIRFSVRDTGIGMTPAQIDKIFEPFMQADISTTRKYGGTGLGLSITNSLLELMNTKLQIESRQGLGSTFSFELDFQAVPVSFKNKQGEFTFDVDDETKKPVFNAEALVCEDNAINRQVIEEHLLKVGITPVTAENGRVGVNMAKTRMRTGKPFDIVLMDIHMPVMDGLEAMQHLIEAGIATPVIAMTANAMREDRDIALASGMSEYICKPFTARELWRCLLKFLTPVRMDEITADGGAEGSGAIIDEVSGLEKAANDPALYKKIKSDFYLENRDVLERMKAAEKEKDFKTAHRLAHTLKGVAYLIGAKPLSEAAHNLEKLYADGKTNEEVSGVLSERLAAVLELLTEQTLKAEEAAKQTSETATREIDVKQAAVIFAALEPLLTDGNSDSGKYIDALSEALPPELYRDLVGYILDYEFDTALREFKRVKEIVLNDG